MARISLEHGTSLHRLFTMYSHDPPEGVFRRIRNNRVPIFVQTLRDIENSEGAGNRQRSDSQGKVSSRTDPKCFTSQLRDVRLMLHHEKKYLLPNPNSKCSGSFTPGLIWPSLRNRLGLNACGSGYTDSSRKIALLSPQPVAMKMPQKRATCHILLRIVVPAGMSCPLYTSSSITRRVAPEAASA